MLEIENVANKKWFTNEQIVKGAIGLITAVGIWYRMEVKFDQAQSLILGKIDVHMAEDAKDKQRLNEQITELRSEVNKMKEQAQEYFKYEYLRPEEPTIKRRRQ